MAGSGYGSAYQGTTSADRSYGSAGEWNRELNNPVSSSSGGDSPMLVVVGVPDSTFRMVAKGLKPNTVHSAFLVARDVSIDCAPIVGSNTSPASNTSQGNTAGGWGSQRPSVGNSNNVNVTANTTYTYGSQLITDAAGNLVFDYHFRPQNAPFPAGLLADRNKVISLVPVGKYLFKVSSTDGTSYAQNYIEAKTASTAATGGAYAKGGSSGSGQQYRSA